MSRFAVFEPRGDGLVTMWEVLALLALEIEMKKRVVTAARNRPASNFRHVVSEKIYHQPRIRRELELFNAILSFLSDRARRKAPDLGNRADPTVDLPLGQERLEHESIECDLCLMKRSRMLSCLDVDWYEPATVRVTFFTDEVDVAAANRNFLWQGQTHRQSCARVDDDLVGERL